MQKKLEDIEGQHTIYSSSNWQGESINKNFTMGIVKKTCPCNLYGSKKHCVAECSKQKFYNKKVHATMSSLRKDDATLQVKESLGKTLMQSRNVLKPLKLELRKIEQEDDHFILIRDNFFKM